MCSGGPGGINVLASSPPGLISSWGFLLTKPAWKSEGVQDLPAPWEPRARGQGWTEGLEGI